MTFDSIVLAAVADELNKKLSAGRVDKITQPSDLDIVLTIRSHNANWQLLISADAHAPRIHFTSIKRPNPQTPPNFCMLLRKYLNGARFEYAEQVDFDRILRLKFSAYDGEPLVLVVEIMGKHSNAILINTTDKILGTIKPVGRSKSRYREVLPGKQYIPPPSQNKINPLKISQIQLEELIAGRPADSDVESWLVRTITGVSPFIAKELAERSGGDPLTLSEEFTAIFECICAAEFVPVLITDDQGSSIGFYPYPSVQFPEELQHERTSISIAAENYYSSAIPRSNFEQSKEAFISRVEKEIAARNHALESIREGIEESRNAERYKQIGELILSQSSVIPPESESAEIIDYYSPDAPRIRIDLDPQLNPAENAQTYFRKYHKAVSGAQTLMDRESETLNEIKILDSVLEKLDEIETIEDIEETTESLTEHGLSLKKQEHVEVEKRKAEFEGHRISRVTSGEWEILIGQNSEANDYLLTRIAKPNDLWFHVKASPSAHVVVRTNGKPDRVPRSVLSEAAELTAMHSDSKHSSLVPVDYTLRKYVRKPKGAPAGKALYTNEKTLFITPGKAH